MKRDTSPTFTATIGYVRGLKINHLTVWCYGKREGGWTCHHNKTISIEGYPDEVTIVSFERRLRCESCGTLGAVDVRPDWSEITGRPGPSAVGWVMPPGGKKAEGNEGVSGDRA